MKFLNLLNRIKEPSTWAGITAFGVLFGLPPGTMDAVGMLVTGIGAVAAILLPEGAGNA
jgi:hypothetical protein